MCLQGEGNHNPPLVLFSCKQLVQLHSKLVLLDKAEIPVIPWSHVSNRKPCQTAGRRHAVLQPHTDGSGRDRNFRRHASTKYQYCMDTGALSKYLVEVGGKGISNVHDVPTVISVVFSTGQASTAHMQH